MDSTHRKSLQQHTAAQVLKNGKHIRASAAGTHKTHGHGKVRADARTVHGPETHFPSPIPPEPRHPVGGDRHPLHKKLPHQLTGHLPTLPLGNERLHSVDHHTDLPGPMNLHLREIHRLIHEVEHHLSTLHGHLQPLDADAPGHALPHRKASHLARHDHGRKHLRT